MGASLRPRLSEGRLSQAEESTVAETLIQNTLYEHQPRGWHGWRGVVEGVVQDAASGRSSVPLWGVMRTPALAVKEAGRYPGP